MTEQEKKPPYFNVEVVLFLIDEKGDEIIWERNGFSPRYNSLQEAQKVFDIVCHLAEGV